MELTKRAWRKYDQDGIKPLLQEGVYLLFELEPVRSLLSRQLLDRNGIKRINYEELCKIARSTNSFWKTFDESEQETTIEPIPSKIRIPKSRSFRQLKTHTPALPAVMEVSNCTIIHPFGLTLHKNGVLQETIAQSATSSSRIGKALSKSVADHGYGEVKQIISGMRSDSLEPFSLATPLLPLWGNYYHWTIESLPRLAGVERYEKETGEQPTIIVPEDPSSWMLESLELLGIDDDRICQLDTHCAVDRLVVPTHPGPTPAECEWLHNQMQATVNKSATNQAYEARIYISRQNATRRRVKNEQEVVDLLQSYGFKKYILEEMSVSDQVALFSNAEFIVAPHGAGLTNVVYADSATVIELFGKSKKTTFYRLAELLEHDYHYLHNLTRNGDLDIDIEQLDGLLKTLTANQNNP